jgi:hypothetical protein
MIDGLESWWADKKINEKHYLRPGINIIKIDKVNGNNNIKIYANAQMDHNVIFSDWI